MFDEEDYFNHESILVVTKKGCLKRLKTPFRVLSVARVNDLQANEVYSVSAVITSSNNIMVYAIGAHCYNYYWFIIL